MDRIARIIEELGHEPIRWNDITTYIPGQITIDDIERVSSEVEAALFILAPDDTATIRGTEVPVTRDNVLIEAGIFHGMKGRKNVGLCRLDSPRTPSDWLGITTISLNEGDNTIRARMKLWIENTKKVGNRNPNNCFFFLAR